MKSKGYENKTICSVCLGVGKIKLDGQPEPIVQSNQPPVLAQFAGSLTGMAGGTVVRR
jgi:hypothetical protein